MTAKVLETPIFEKSNPGARGVSLPVFSLDSTGIKSVSDFLPEGLTRKKLSRLPELAQLDTIRHYVRLSQLNHCIDTGFYPLGSCTMKFNPKVCDLYGQLDGFTQLHPLTPESLSQGSLEVMYRLQQYLADVSGFDRVTLQPAAGAQGELVGMMMVKAYFKKHQQPERTQVLIPDAAHGTNPASAAMCGFEVIELKSNREGGVDLDELKQKLSVKTAALMLTNPNTLGLFERDILEITRLVHEAGGLMYYDGANLNAVMGQAKPALMGFDVMHINTHKTFATPHGGGGPGSGPVAVNNKLAPFLPKPYADFDGSKYFLNFDLPDSIGKVKAFWGNFEMMARAFTYISAYGSDGLARVSQDAVLNANYLKEKLKSMYHVPYDLTCKHEFVMTSQRQKVSDPHINTMAIVKRLMDFGIHPPTVYFPLIVAECIMIEPTDTESKETLDRFIEVMTEIDRECRETPDVILNAPHTTPIGKVDEVAAARNPDLNYFSAVKAD